MGPSTMHPALLWCFTHLTDEWPRLLGLCIHQPKMMHCSKPNIYSLPHPNALHRLLPQVRQQRPPPHPSLPPSASTLSVVSFVIAPRCLRLCCGFFPTARHNFSLLCFQASCKFAAATATLREVCEQDLAHLTCKSNADEEAWAPRRSMMKGGRAAGMVVVVVVVVVVAPFPKTCSGQVGERAASMGVGERVGW